MRRIRGKLHYPQADVIHRQSHGLRLNLETRVDGHRHEHDMACIVHFRGRNQQMMDHPHQRSRERLDGVIKPSRHPTCKIGEGCRDIDLSACTDALGKSFFTYSIAAINLQVG